MLYWPSRRAGGLRHRHQRSAPRRDGEGASSCSRPPAAARSRRRSSSAGAAATWRPTRFRAWSSSPTRLPKSATGKVQWRLLQERELQKQPHDLEIDMEPDDYKHLAEALPEAPDDAEDHAVVQPGSGATRYPDKPITIFYDSQLSATRSSAARPKRWRVSCSSAAASARATACCWTCRTARSSCSAYYAILRADAVVVPVSPMNVTDELEHYLGDSGATHALVAQDAVRAVPAVAGQRARARDRRDLLRLSHRADRHSSSRAADGATPELSPIRAWSAGTTRSPPATQPRRRSAGATISAPSSTPPAPPAIPRAACTPTAPSCARPWAAQCGKAWRADSVALATAPMFHVTGMQHSMNAPIYAGATIALLPRWDPDAAGYMIERYAVHALGQRADHGGRSAGASGHRRTRSVLAAEHLRRRSVHARSGGAEALRAVRHRSTWKPTG